MQVFGGQPLVIITNLDQVLSAAGTELDRDTLTAMRADYMACIAAGIGPHCEQPIARRVQAGRCVPAAPCGHRLYQGVVLD